MSTSNNPPTHSSGGEKLERENVVVTTQPSSPATSAPSSVNQGGTPASTLGNQLTTAKDTKGKGGLIQEPQKPRNIIIFGSSGVGKSSIVNLLLGRNAAQTGNNAKGCTFETKEYPVKLGGTDFTLWDTAGLDESDIGTIPAERAIEQLYDLIINKMQGRGLSLLIFCVRAGRVSKAIGHNWKLFVNIVCQSKVPVCLAITGLGDHQPAGGAPDDAYAGDVMKTWWEVLENQDTFAALGVKPQAVACITAIEGKPLGEVDTPEGKKKVFQYGREYEASRKILTEKILATIATYSPVPWTPAPIAWLETVTELVRNEGCWPFSAYREERIETVKTGKAFKALQDLYQCSEAGTWTIIGKLTGTKR